LWFVFWGFLTVVVCPYQNKKPFWFWFSPGVFCGEKCFCYPFWCPEVQIFVGPGGSPTHTPLGSVCYFHFLARGQPPSNWGGVLELGFICLTNKKKTKQTNPVFGNGGFFGGVFLKDPRFFENQPFFLLGFFHGFFWFFSNKKHGCCWPPPFFFFFTFTVAFCLGFGW